MQWWGFQNNPFEGKLVTFKSPYQVYDACSRQPDGNEDGDELGKPGKRGNYSL